MGRRNERGSALLLVPAGIIIVMALGAMTVNAALSYMAERSAARLASEVANDLATLGLDDEHFRSTGEYQLVPDISTLANDRVAVAVTSAGGAFVPGTLQISVRRLGADEIEVRVTADVELLLHTPGGPTTRQVSAVAIGTASPGN
ncbi:MAG: hypothetical protein GY708_04270 [Actinomycetia bacterium]|nr:hypothetical protein [Actinomycetes bacterium]